MSHYRVLVVLLMVCGLGPLSLCAQEKLPDLSSIEAKSAIERFLLTLTELEDGQREASTKLNEVYQEEVNKLIEKLVPGLQEKLDAESAAGNLDAALKTRETIKKYKEFRIEVPEQRVKPDSTLRELDRKIAALEKQIEGVKTNKKPTVKKPAIPKNAVRFNGHSYLRVDDQMTKRIAEQFAEKNGGHLARIESAEELAFVNKLIQGAPHSWYTIDGDDEETEGVFVWSNGAPVTFFDWDSQQPTGEKPGHLCQHELVLAKANGKMHDGVCGQRDGFIIEWDE